MAAFTLLDGDTSVSTDPGQDLFLTVNVGVDNPVEGDLDLANGDLHLTTGEDALRQDLQSRGRFVLGEWFLNLEEGIPYFEHVLVKNPNSAVVRNIFRRMIVETPGVGKLISLVLTLDPETRGLVVSYEVTPSNGGPSVSGDFTAFVMRGLPS